MKIVIVGGGFSGTMMAYHLVKNSRLPLHITLLERSIALARGVAYETNDSIHLLNVPADSMSALPERPEHFLDWLQTRGELQAQRKFYSRKLYGEYLHGLLAEAQHESEAKKMSLNLIRDEALGAVREPSGKIKVSTRETGEILCDRLVLATGPLCQEADPFLSVRNSPRFISSFWTDPEWRQIAKNATVTVLGTGLSMIDAVASLQKRQHETTIHAVSRHGLLPQPHGDKAVDYSFTLPMNLKPRQLLRVLRDEVARGALNKMFGWRDVVDSLRPHVNFIWKNWSHAEKQQFLGHLKPYWETHRHKMAPEIDSMLQSLKANGQLKIHRSRIQSIERLDRGFMLFLKYADGGQHTLRTEYLIDCTGSAKGTFTSPLCQSLLDNALIMVHESTLGIATDEHGQCTQGVYVLGPLRKGSLWETTAVPELRVQAQQLALRLLEDML